MLRIYERSERQKRNDDQEGGAKERGVGRETEQREAQHICLLVSYGYFSGEPGLL